jgi:nudix-type nucleoside diphosphatase (YffH/AdpP family)
MKYKIHHEEIAYNGYLKILKAKLEHDVFDSDESLEVTREACHRGDSCAILLFEKETGKFIFTRQFRYPTTKTGGGWITEIVAGNIEEGESPEESMRREVEEEVGYTVSKMESLGHFFLSPGRSTERIFLFFSGVSIKEKTGEGGGSIKENESIQTLKYSLDELRSMLANNELEDAKSIIAVQRYLLGL